MHWVAFYNDGTSLREFAEDGKQHSSENIERSTLSAFVLMTDGFVECFRLNLKPSQRLIFRRRHEQRTGGEKYTVTFIGWQSRETDQQMLCAIFGEGERIELFGEWREGHPFFDPIALVPAEISDGLKVLSQAASGA